MAAALPHLGLDLATAGDPVALTRQLLACAYQPTANSGEVTRTAAREVATAVGAEFHLFEVDALFRGYCSTVEAAVGRPLTWERDDVALQNIQARVRAPSIWLLANLRGAILLTTSNRSEAAVGYATIDGDTSGGLAPLGGIDKTYLRVWLRWMEATGLAGLAPIAALRFINAQQPTAELRPPGAAQTDEKDQMPYDVLEAIEDEAIRDKRMPLEVLDDAGVIMGGSADFRLTLSRSNYNDFIGAVKTNWLPESVNTAEGSAARQAFDEAYLSHARLDPYHTIAALKSTPVLAIQGSLDQAVPSALGDVLWSRLGEPEALSARWKTPLSHETLFLTLPARFAEITAWIDGVIALPATVENRSEPTQK